MRLRVLREQAFAETEPKESPVAKAVKKLPSDWEIGFEAGDSMVKEPRCYFYKKFSISSPAYGTAFKSRIKAAEQKLDHRCHEIQALPGNKLKITLTTHGADTVTEKDGELARLINLAYDPHGTNKGMDYSKDAPANATCQEMPAAAPSFN